MECSVCSNPFDQQAYRPMVLSCGHTFCHKCVVCLLDSTRECPNDRKPIRQSLEEIPPNYDLCLATEMLEKATVTQPEPSLKWPSPVLHSPSQHQKCLSSAQTNTNSLGRFSTLLCWVIVLFHAVFSFAAAAANRPTKHGGVVCVTTTSAANATSQIMKLHPKLCRGVHDSVTCP